MACPFPGMDPYIERPALWPDFHDSIITAIRGLLQPVLRPRYAALTQDRLCVVIAEDAQRSAMAMLDSYAAGISRSEGQLRQTALFIIELAAGNRIVTAIEVLSPDNKQSGCERESYIQKRDQLWTGGANLVEIDLLRDGELTVMLAPEIVAEMRDWNYLVTVSHPDARQEIYTTTLQKRLQRILVPLASDDKGIVLHLQAAFTRCWNEGPYPELLHYGNPPPGIMTPEEIQWCEQVLANWQRN